MSRHILFDICLVAALMASLPLQAQEKSSENERGKGKKKSPPAPVHWKKTVIDRSFRSEGVAVADVNKDGKKDILVGDVWYEAPKWKMHVIRKDRKFNPKNYSETFACWADDLNQDGWQDLIVIGFPGKPCHWYENPQNKKGPWKEHTIWHSACNETPQYLDLFKTGKRVLIMGWQPKDSEVKKKKQRGRLGQMAWFAPGKDPTKTWIMHPISKPSTAPNEIPGTFKYAHGLGAGDVNGDKRLDVITTGGWWEQPKKAGNKPWKFHAAKLAPACADMFALDIDGDSLNDVISSSAHNYGIWWHRQIPGAKGRSFAKREIMFKLFSQSHALHLVDINGDGLKDLVTGRRWWAHGGRDPGGDGPAVLYWFEARKYRVGIIGFLPHKIDDDSGIGTQFVVTDINGDGKPDIIVSNKKGVFLTQQLAKIAPTKK